MKWNEEDLIYAAGFLDGEGCFYAHPKSHKVSVSCSNTYAPTILWLGDTFGGSLFEPKKKQPHHRQIYTWQVVSGDARILCGAIVPYLREKKEQALAILSIQQTMEKGKLAPQEVREERQSLVDRVKELKYVNWKR